MRVYSWNDWNTDHIGQHQVLPAEARYVIEHARRSYPQYCGKEKWRVRGKTALGRWLQVVFIYPDDEDIDPDSLAPADLLAYSNGQAQVVYVIHAPELTEKEKPDVRKRG
jgi:hypothetical protein